MTVQTIQTEECISHHDNEQVGNPVQTRLDFEQAIDMARKCILDSTDANKRAMQVMLALFDLHEAEDRPDGFTPVEMIEAAHRYNKRIALNAEDPGRKIRTYWKELEADWPNKAEVLAAQSKRVGFNWIIKPEKKESSGGTGRTSRYCLACIALNESSSIANLAVQKNVNAHTADIFYYPADISDCGIVVRKLAEGFELVGWKRRIFLFVMISLLMAFGVLLVAFSWWLTQLPIHGDFRALVSTGLIIAMSVATTNPILSLPFDRIVKAPWWLQWQTHDVLLEWRSPPRYSSKTIKAIRYAAVCPVCGGEVHVGVKEFRLNPRLRGRCIEAPKSHVFSFDHVTLQGNRIYDNTL